jgi:hypothetical protein
VFPFQLLQRVTPNACKFKREKHFFSIAIAVPNAKLRQNKISGRNQDSRAARQSNDGTTFAPDGRK